ncbi:MAG: hypothetical protein LBL62_03280 [Planctomycetaceae bacterium]|nr:hypothetical protein [Planctomycetaceae bacterium]
MGRDVHNRRCSEAQPPVGLLPNKALQGRDNFMIFALHHVLIMSSLRDFVGVNGLLSGGCAITSPPVMHMPPLRG